MGAKWAKNEVTAVKRRCDMIVQKTDGSLAPRGTDFIDLGNVYISGVASPHFALALGTLTNQRRPLSFDDVEIESVHVLDPEGPTPEDSLTMTAHPFETGDGPVRLEVDGGSAPAGLAEDTDYWVIAYNEDTIQLAATLADAYAGTPIDITTTGSPTLLIVDTADTQRGLDGHFTYEATQEETDHDAPETVVIVHDGSDYDRDVGSGGYTTVTMESSAADEGAVLLEGSITRDDARRIILRTHAAKSSVVGNVQTWRDMADSKDSHHGTVTAAGRIDAGVDDPT